MSNAQAEQQIVIYGGGMAGAQLAKALAPEFRITLVDPNEYFEVPMSVPRSLVQPDFAESAIVPFATALPNVRHVRAKLIELRPEGGLVQRADGHQELLRGDVSVLATGSTFSNALMRASDGASAQERRGFYATYLQRIAAAQNIVIVGGGPIGVEVAGEIIEHFPQKHLTILEAGSRILAGTSMAASKHATSVLERSGVRILTGERLVRAGSNQSEVLAGGGNVVTSQGRDLPYDLLIWCIGGRPNTSYMQPHFAAMLNSAGRIRVTPDLLVAGMPTVFALGDITDLDENKMAWHINGQVKCAAHNIRKLMRMPGNANGYKAYKPQTGNPKMAVTLGSRNGVLHLPMIGVVRSPFLNRLAKAGHMLVPQYRKALGLKG